MWIVIIACIALIVLIVISQHQELTRSHRTFSTSIVNHDSAFREFVYRVDRQKSEIWTLLDSHNVHAPMKYRFSEADSTIVFSPVLPDGSLDITYHIHISEHDGYCMIKIVQVNHLLEKNKFIWLQNEFWHHAIGAVPVPYE